jgi:hypothetical protein
MTLIARADFSIFESRYIFEPRRAASAIIERAKRSGSGRMRKEDGEREGEPPTSGWPLTS